MKRTVWALLCLALPAALLLTACATATPGTPATPGPDVTETPAPQETASPAPEETPPPSAEGLSGPLIEVVRRISDDAGSRIGEYGVGMVFDTEVSAENQNITLLGITEEQFSTHVTDAAVSQGMLAHLTALIQCKDEAAAREMKSLIAAGFNPGWMVCVSAEECVVVESGVYVYLAASTSQACEELLVSFDEAAGGMGTPDRFHLGVTGGDGGGIEIAP